jgi:hypothetical protein
MLTRLLGLLGAVSLLAACGTADSGGEVGTGDEQDLTATSGSFSLGLNALASVGGKARIHGVASEALDSARAFIPDDEVGFTKLAPKSFTSNFGPSEVVLFLNGRPAFFSVTTPVGGRFVGRGDLGVKMHLSSPVGIKVTSAAQSVLVNGVPMIRVKGTFGETLVAAKTSINGVDVAGVVSGKTWRFDYPLPFIGGVLANPKQIWILLTTAHDDFSGELDAALQVRKAALTTGDAYEVWPAPTCAPAILSCLQQPANATDTAACGDAFNVGPCWKQLHP